MMRPYGPGKFDTILDSYVYDLSMDGGCEELGNVETFNHYVAIELGEDALNDLEDDLTEEEEHLVMHSFGAIAETTSQGFVFITYYPTKKGFDHAWQKLEEAWEEFEEEEE